MNISSETLKRLQMWTASDRGVRAVFGGLARRKRNPTRNQTSVDEVIESDPELPRGKAVEALRRLADEGLGKFKHGRRKHPSRIEWDVAPLAIAKAVMMEATEDGNEVRSNGSGVTTKAKIAALEHPFVVRKGETPVVFKLPVDLTPEEAERISAFIKSLAIPV